MLAIIVGMKSEARLAQQLALFAIGGGTTHGATIAAQYLIDQGATALISLGIAGGLDPTLPPGTLIHPTHIIDGQTRYLTTSTLIPWAPPPDRTLAGSHTPLATAAQKSALYQQTAAAAVDMESHAVARIATAHNLPFTALRAIADPATTTLPPAALIPLLPDGRPNLKKILASLATNPAQLAALITLAHHARLAHDALRKALPAATKIR